MAIIINSGSYSDAGWWTNHLKKAETNERVEIIGFYGLSAESIEDAFAEMRAMAQGSKATNFFSQYNINPQPGERLTEQQWEEAHALHRKNHGLDHLPYFRVRHVKDGRVHEHGIALRVDPETHKAIPDSLTARINERTSRTLEITFGLQRGRSILTPDRECERPERRPKKRETFREGERKVDVETVKADARAAREQADNGRSFRAALEASGDYVVASGDRRDFVIIDRTGEVHSLPKRLGMKTAEVRAFMADLDPSSLPSVAEAKARQQARHVPQEQQQPAPAPGMENHPAAAEGPYGELQAAQTASQFETAAGRITGPRPQGFDRDAANAAWEDQLAAAAIAAQEARQQAKHGAAAERDRPAAEGRYAALQTPEPPPEAKPERELSGTAAEIRMAWALSRTMSELEDGLAARGIGLALVSAEEAYASERHADLAKETGNFVPAWREGEIVAVDGRGAVYRLDERTTGDGRGEIAGRLAGIDRAALMNVADTQEAMRAASLTAWKAERQAEREQARPASWIEQKIAACATDAPAAVVHDAEGRAVSRAEALGERFRAEDECSFTAATATGAEAFFARLDQAGIALARVTAAAEPALAALRHDAEMKQTAADTNNESVQVNRFADVLPGELAAVTASGDVYRINPAKLGDAARYIPENLPGVIETRDRFAAERRDIETHWELKQAEIAAGRAAFDEGLALRATMHGAEDAVHAAIETPLEAAGDAIDAGLSFSAKAARVFQSLFGAIFGAFMAEPKQTAQQIRDEIKAATNEETVHARGVAADARAREAEFDWQEHYRKSAQQQKDVRLAQTLGFNPTAEANINRDEADRQRERERERDP